MCGCRLHRSPPGPPGTSQRAHSWTKNTDGTPGRPLPLDPPPAPPGHEGTSTRARGARHGWPLIPFPQSTPFDPHPLTAQTTSAMAPAKDPNQPKRGRNAYLIFTQERSAQIRRDQPTLGFGDVTREAAAQWKALSAEEKKVGRDARPGSQLQLICA